MNEDYLIGLDIGTGGAKGLLVASNGKVVATATASYPLLTPQPGWSEQNPEDWWEATVKVLKDLMQKGKGYPVGLGLTGQMHGAVFLDRDGQVLRPAILWNDARTGAECREIEERVGSGRLREITGNPALAGFQAPKILWLRNHEPRNYSQVRHVLLPKDYVRFRLTGKFATDASDAAGTLLLALEERNWSEEILSALKIPHDWLPQIYEGPEVTGEVSEEAAHITGVPAGTPVVAGGADNAAAAIGSGIIRPGTGLLSLGTSGVILVHTETPRIDPSGALHSFCHAVPGKYYSMGVILSAGGSLHWFRDAIGAPEIVAAGKSTTNSYDLLVAEAAASPPGAGGLFFLPYLAGERTPHMDPDARGAWIGLSLAHRRKHLIRAVLEGVGFAFNDAWERIIALELAPPVLRLVGGGAQSGLWRKIIASILNVPLQRLEIEEGPAFGAALLAGVGCGMYNTVGEAIEQVVRLKGELEKPDPSLVAIYRREYKRYIKLYPALKKSGVWGDPAQR